MATVYKVEIELVSDWINYPPEDVEKIVKEQIGKSYAVSGNDLKVTEVKAERTS